MMEFTVSLLVGRPRRRAAPVSSAELRHRLMAINQTDVAYLIAESKTSDLEVRWDAVAQTRRQRFALVKLDSIYRARMLFDEQRCEVRWYESLRTSNIFLGLDGWRPRFQLGFEMSAGYVNAVWSGRAYGILPGFPPRIGDVQSFSFSTVEVKKQVADVIAASGWTFRPVLLWFQVSRRTANVVNRVLPPRLREIPARRFWGVLYPLFYLLAMVYLAVALGGLDAHNLSIMLFISAIWWGVWGLLTWAWLGCPAFWRRKRPKRESR